MTVVWPSSSTASRSSCEHVGAGGGVEVAGRLVGEQHGRLGDERAGDRDALLLAAGELRRLVVAALGEADALDQRVDRRASGLRPAIASGSEDVLLRGQRRQQVEGLEDEADVAAAQAGELLSDIAVMSSPPIVHAAGVGRSSPASRCISVDLPEPDGPMTAVNWPAGTSSETPRSASTAESPSP